MMNEIPTSRSPGFFALVSYIPDPLGSFLHGLRQTLPGTDNPEPHITVLPRRVLQHNLGATVSAVETASREARLILGEFPAFEVELSYVRHFSETNVLYLEIAKGNDRLHDLHDALNTGTLAHPEEFEFRPHLTLSGPVEPGDLDSARRRAEAAWNDAPWPRRFMLDEIVGLWRSSNTQPGQWQRLWNQRLSGRTSATTAS